MRVFIAQPMNGLTNEQIISDREKATEIITKLFPDESIQVIDNLQFDTNEFDKLRHARIGYLGNSIKMLADADASYFVEGWREARGCNVEHLVCVEYGIKIIKD